MELSAATLVQSLAAGLAAGFVVSIPVGPINLAVINYALRKGFGAAFLLGIGAIAAECLYAALMLAGHSTVLEHPRVTVAMRVVAVLVVAGLGVRYLLFKPGKVEANAAEIVQKVDERWHHPRSFLLGFILTASNLLLVLLWATLAALLFAHEWVVPVWPSRTLCVVGVFIGGLTWFFLLAFFVSRAHRRVKPQTLAALVRACGGVFLAIAVLLAVRLFLR